MVAVVVISWTMGSEEPLVIPGYSGTENVPFWLKLTDMFLYSIYILSKIEALTSEMEDSSISLLDMVIKYDLKYKK